MERALFLALIFLSGCSLIALSQGEACGEGGAIPRCEGDTLVVCDPDQSFELRQTCGEGTVCDAEGGVCNFCGDGVLGPGEDCDLGDENGDGACSSSCSLGGDGVCG